MKDSKAIRGVVEAYQRGYRVDAYGVVVGPRGRPRKCTVGTNGFWRFNIWEKHRGGRIHVYVHKLAAYQQFGDRIREDGLCVRFLNGDRKDCRPCNVVLSTRSDIMMATPLLKRMAYAANAARKLRALSDEQLAMFREARASGVSLADLSRLYNISKSTASYIANGKTYT